MTRGETGAMTSIRIGKQYEDITRLLLCSFGVRIITIVVREIDGYRASDRQRTARQRCRYTSGYAAARRCIIRRSATALWR
jgi:hypothetical protein